MKKFAGTIIIAAVLAGTVASAAASGRTDTTLSPTASTQTELIATPLYEQYNATKNYYFNQLVMNTLRWTTVGALSGAAVGGIMDLRDVHNGYYIFIPKTFIAGLIGMGIGFTGAIPAGLVTGGVYQRRKSAQPYFHTHRNRFGYEVPMLTLSPFPIRNAIRAAAPGTMNTLNFALVVRPLLQNPYIPDKITLGFYADRWRHDFDYAATRVGALQTMSIEGGFRYNFSTRKLLQPYWAAGIGWAWGTEEEESREPYYDSQRNMNDSRALSRNEYVVRSAVLRGYLGGELNLFDFFYADFKTGYECIGPYIVLKHKEHFPYVQNFLVSVALGTFIF